MRENKMYPCNKSSLLLCAFALILASPTALAQPTDPFDDIFGEFSDHGQVNRLLEKEKAKHGKKPVSPLTSEILLSEDTLKRTEAAIKRMEKIVRKGGWPVQRTSAEKR